MMIATVTPIAHLLAVVTICATLIFSPLIATARAVRASYEDHVIELLPFKSVRVATSGNLSMETSYVLFQVHTQLHDVVMSYKDLHNDRDIKLDQFIAGNNVGLIVQMEEDDREAFVYVKNPNNKIVNALVITSAHPFQGKLITD